MNRADPTFPQLIESAIYDTTFEASSGGVGLYTSMNSVHIYAQSPRPGLLCI
jgi:hypothetical protein